MKRFLLICTLALAAPAFAQQSPPAAEQALSDRLIVEIQSNVQARTQLIETQRKLDAAEAKIKDLSQKKPDAPPPQ